METNSTESASSNDSQGSDYPDNPPRNFISVSGRTKS